MTGNPITPDEFYARMTELQRDKGGDLEAWHSLADNLMCDLLRQLGYDRGVDVYMASERWYA
jgi:hypothetical protein